MRLEVKMSKTHFKKLMNPNYLGSWDVPEGQEIEVVILRVEKELVTGAGGEKEECVVATLKEHKPFILNATNCKAIKKIFDSPYIEDWQNKSVRVRVEKVKAFGEIHDALRVVNKKVAQKPELTPEHEKWNGAVEALKNGKCNIDLIKKNFRLSDENSKKLEEVSNA
jgi:hypothetical protein